MSTTRQPHSSDLLHLNLRNVTFCNVTPSLISWNTRERMCSVEISLLCCHTSLSYIIGSDIKIIHSRKQTTWSHWSRCHHCIIIIIIIAILTLCYSIMSCATLIIYYHTSMLTLHTCLTPRALSLPHVWYSRGVHYIEVVRVHVSALEGYWFGPCRITYTYSNTFRNEKYSCILTLKIYLKWNTSVYKGI